MTSAERRDDAPKAPATAVAWPLRFRDFVKESWHEVRHEVTWPTWEEVKGTTQVVVIATLLFAAYLSALDFIMVFIIHSAFGTAR